MGCCRSRAPISPAEPDDIIVTVKIASGGTIRLPVKPSDSVSNVKAKLRSADPFFVMSRLSDGKESLKFNGNELDDGTTMDQAAVQSGSVLRAGKGRRCTDLVCLIVFLIFQAGYIFVSLGGAQDGDPFKLYQPRDYQGAYCGAEKNWNNGLDLANYEKLSFTMNVTESVDVIAKQLLCSTAARSWLVSSASSLSQTQKEDYQCECCLIPCQSCAGSLDNGGDLTDASSLSSTISSRMGALSGSSSDSLTSLFDPSGSNGDLFSSMWDQAATYFNSVCLESCSVDYTAATNQRTYRYSPAPDNPLLPAWNALLAGPSTIANTMQTDFEFNALPASMCPYSEQYCVPFPGVKFKEVAAVGYCQFEMAAEVVGAVGSSAADAFESLGSNNVAGTMTESFGSLVGDFMSSLDSFIVVSLLSFVVGLVFLVLLRFLVGCCVWGVIFLMFVMLIFAGFVAYVRSDQCLGASLLESGTQTAQMVTATAVTSATQAASGDSSNENLEGDGSTYVGVSSHTKSGIRCQSWSEQTPHSHSYTAAQYPSLAGAENYCRNPYNAGDRFHASTIWCFTTDPDVVWGECNPLGVIQAPECANGYAVEGESSRELLKIAAYVLWALAGVWILCVCCFQKQIRIAIAATKTGALFIIHNKLSLLVPVVTGLTGIIWAVVWALSAAFLLSQVPEDYTPTGYFESYAEAYGTEDTPGKCNDVWPTGSVWKDEACDSSQPPKCWRCYPPRYVFDIRFAISFFVYLWNNAFLIACGQTIIAAAVAVWFFSPKGSSGAPSDAPKVRNIAVAESTKMVLWYHSGSLAMGAFLIALVQFIRYVAMYFEQQAKAQKNRIMVVVLKIVQCCLWCVEKCMKFLTKNAYIQIAIMGTNFCTSAKEAIRLLMWNAIRFAAVAALGTMIEYIGVAFIIGGTVGAGYFILINMNPDVSPVVPLILYGFVSWIVGTLYMTVFRLAVDTSLMCFIRLEEKGGVQEGDDFVPKPFRTILKSAGPADGGGKQDDNMDGVVPGS